MASTIHITNATIDNITREGSTRFVTVTYIDQRVRQTVTLIVNNSTIILSENSRPVPVVTLQTGTTIDAVISSAMTRSIPPQATAFLIKIIRQPMRDNITTGTILDVNRQNRNFTTIQNGNLSSIIRFNVPKNTVVLNRNGIPMNFSRLVPGMRIRVRHASFMTASIPPQTTAFEVRVL